MRWFLARSWAAVLTYCAALEANLEENMVPLFLRCKQSIDDPFDESGQPKQKSWKANRWQWAKAAPAGRND